MGATINNHGGDGEEKKGWYYAITLCKDPCINSDTKMNCFSIFFLKFETS